MSSHEIGEALLTIQKEFVRLRASLPTDGRVDHFAMALEHSEQLLKQKSEALLKTIADAPRSNALVPSQSGTPLQPNLSAGTGGGNTPVRPWTTTPSNPQPPEFASRSAVGVLTGPSPVASRLRGFGHDVRAIIGSVQKMHIDIVNPRPHLCSLLRAELRVQVSICVCLHRIRCSHTLLGRRPSNMRWKHAIFRRRRPTQHNRPQPRPFSWPTPTEPWVHHEHHSTLCETARWHTKSYH